MVSLFKFCYLVDTTGVRGGLVERVSVRIEDGWIHLGIYYLLTSGDFPLGAKPWPVKEEDVIRLKANDTRMVRWMCIVRLDDTFCYGT